ncbi:DUF1629 domain-containing protein, partial [Stappia taiwanensis]
MKRWMAISRARFRSVMTSTPKPERRGLKTERASRRPHSIKVCRSIWRGYPNAYGGGGKRELADLLKTASHFLVSGKMRDAIEVLEPGVHQFQLVELIWSDGSHAADYFWFNICNRVDGMDREKTTHPFNDRIGRWSFVEGRKYVVSLKQTAGFHAWIDSRLT